MIAQKQHRPISGSQPAEADAIPGLLEVHVGSNLSRHRSVYESGGVMKFTDEAALLAYNTHPLHLALLDWLVPLIEPIEVDFRA